jgi:hypothetical protein
MQDQPNTTTLRPFDRQDWAAFAGVDNPNPLIAFHKEYAIIQDGNRLCVIHGEHEHAMTLPSARIANLTGNALLADLQACDGQSDREVAILHDYDFSDLIDCGC